MEQPILVIAVGVAISLIQRGTAALNNEGASTQGLQPVEVQVAIGVAAVGHGKVHYVTHGERPQVVVAHGLICEGHFRTSVHRIDQIHAGSIADTGHVDSQ